MLAADDLRALWLTLELAAVSTGLLLLFGTPLAWWLARTRWRARFVIEAVIALPLVLPPTVLGFYLLLLLSPGGAVGGALASLGVTALAFSFEGLVLGSLVYSLPFVVQPLQGAFRAMGRRPLEVAATLRAGPVDRFVHVALPLAWPGVLTATVLGFAHTVGEFGVVLMVGGNIPGETKVLSIAIYEHVEALDYASAHVLSAGLLLLSLVMLVAVYGLNRRFDWMRP